MKLSPVLLAVLALTPVAAFACASDPTTEPPAPGVCTGELTAFRFPHGGDGHADPFGAKAAGQARAGRVRDASQIVQGADARHKVRPGDIAMANDKIAVYVEAEGESDGYFPFGGEILAIEPVGADGRPLGVSEYGETALTFGLETVAPDRVTVLADGSDGKAAVVRASGVLKSIPFLSTFRLLAPEDYGFPIAFDYILEPGAERVKIKVSLVNTRTDEVDLGTKQYFGFFHGSRGQQFTEAHGFGPAQGESPLLAWDNPRATFAFRPVGTTLRAEIEIAGFQFFSIKGQTLAPCEKKELDYVDVITAAGGIDALLEAKRRVLAEPAWREVRGVVTEAQGAGLPGATVHLLSPSGTYLSRATTDARGAFVLHAPPGGGSLVTTLQGFTSPTPLPLADGTNDVTLTVPTRATIKVDARDADTNEALPVRVQVIPVTPIVRSPPEFGVRQELGDRLWQSYAVTGVAELPVPPGQHRVVVTRGYEYELFDAVVDATAGKVANVTATLKRSVDSSGVMCADLHIHSNYSVDSDDGVEAKVKGAIADGLEIPVSSEHEYIIDFQPTINRLGLGKWAFGMPSEELTTFTWGHFGVVPVYPKEGAVNNGAVAWVGKKPAEIFAAVNQLEERPVLVVNHPSGGGFLAYFSAAGFERSRAAGDPDLWSDAFAAVEVFNASDFEANRNQSVADWFALLNAGKTYWAVGNSDSHHQISDPVGYPRTCLRFGHDDPKLLSPEKVRDVLRTGAATVSGGLTMKVEGPGGVQPGGTGQAGAYKVTVACPGWLSASKLEVIVDGTTVKTLDLTPAAGPGPGKRYETTVEVAPSESRARHWVVFHAKGDGDLAPLHPGKKPFAASNPVFF